MNRQQRRAAMRRGQTIAESPAPDAATAVTQPGVAQLLQTGLMHQQAGRVSEAAFCYRRVLSVVPNHADALHQLGMLAYHAGDFDRAVKLIGRAIQQNRNNPVYYANRGLALQSLNRLDEAVASYDRAIALKLDLTEAYYNRGRALRDLGRPIEAIASHDRAIALKPDMAEAYSNRGIALMDLDRLEEALENYDRALSIRPDYADGLNNRGLALQLLERSDEALASYNRAIAIMPNHAEALYNRGRTLHQADCLDEALESYDRALATRPDHAEALNNRALCLVEVGRLDEALQCYERALAVKPDLVQAANNRGLALQEAGRFEGALQSYDQALAIKPDYAECRYNRGTLLLLTGCYAEGWEDYEWRRRLDSWTPRSLPGPEWSNREPEGRRLFFYTEQGLGDTIQFCRFACAVAASGEEVFLEVQSALVRLLSGLKNVNLIRGGEALREYDAHLPLMSLPRALQVTPETLPASVPYLAVEPARVAAWAEKLPASELRVGIAWQGKPFRKLDKGRSIPLQAFAPLCRIPRVKLISLQKHDGLEQLESLPPDMIVETLGEEFDAGPDAFIDCAAVMMSLDLVISSDTAVAHLAGALGRPLWVVLKHVPEWRWMLARHDSPWYPTARLFRQRRPGDWGEVFERVAAELAAVVGRKKAPHADLTG